MHVPMYTGASEPCDIFLKLEDDNSLTTHYAKTATTSRPAPIRMCCMVRGAWSAELAVFLHTFITDVSDECFFNSHVLKHGCWVQTKHDIHENQAGMYYNAPPQALEYHFGRSSSSIQCSIELCFLFFAATFQGIQCFLGSRSRENWYGWNIQRRRAISGVRRGVGLEDLL